MKIKLKVGQKVRFRNGDIGEVVDFRKDYASDPQPFRAYNNKSKECWYYTEDGKWDPDVGKCEEDIVEILENPDGEKVESVKITKKDVGREYIGRTGKKYKISGFNGDEQFDKPVAVEFNGFARWVMLTAAGRAYTDERKSGFDFMCWADETTDEAPKGKYLAHIEWDNGDDTWLHCLHAATFEQVRDNVSDLMNITEDDWGVVEMLDSAKQGTAVAFNKDVYIAGSHIGTLKVEVRLS